MKFTINLNSFLSREVLYELEAMQSDSCKTEMQFEMAGYIPTLKFSSHAERLLAEDIFKKSWLVARYLKREAI